MYFGGGLFFATTPPYHRFLILPWVSRHAVVLFRGIYMRCACGLSFFYHNREPVSVKKIVGSAWATNLTSSSGCGVAFVLPGFGAQNSSFIFFLLDPPSIPSVSQRNGTCPHPLPPSFCYARLRSLAGAKLDKTPATPPAFHSSLLEKNWGFFFRRFFL